MVSQIANLFIVDAPLERLERVGAHLPQRGILFGKTPGNVGNVIIGEQPDLVQPPLELFLDRVVHLRSSSSPGAGRHAWPCSRG